VDEALRRLERGDDPLAHAVALRRAGKELEARRLIEERVRAGDEPARALLDALWPLTPDDQALIFNFEHHSWPHHAGLSRWAENDLTELLGEEDPRLDRVREGLLLQADAPGPGQDPAALAGFLALHRGPLGPRRREALASGSTLALTRIRLDADEAATLLSSAEGAPTEGARESRGVGAPLRLLAALWHIGRARAVARAPVVERHLRHPDLLVASEAWRTLETLGAATARRPPTARLLPDLPFRPVWVPVGCPGPRLRDPHTGAHDRRIVPGLLSGAPVTALLLDIDALRRVRDEEGHEPVDQLLHALTRGLQEAVGDRVVRWGGDEWLVPLEVDADARAVGDRLRASVESHDLSLFLTATVGIGRGETLEAGIKQANAALERGKAAGGDRTEG
jgi:diguanylate cyclase (GGDEF)-like protein